VNRPELAATLVQLRRRVDDHFAAAVARTPAAFRCAPGCASCCVGGLGVFEVEAAPIRDALARLDPALRARLGRQADDPAHDACALLVDGRCAVYAERPLICRSHGLPVVPDAGAAPSHCPLNFTADPPPRASILRLDAVNQPLAVLATLWSATGERSPEVPDPGARVPLADLARQAAARP
jgi:Fe-S-cluster containining protein